MDDNFDVSLEKLEHLGLIKPTIKVFGLDTKMEELLPKRSNNYKP